MDKAKVKEFIEKFNKTGIIICVLYLLEVFVTNDGLIVIFWGGIAILAGVIRALWALIRRRRELALERAVRVILYILLIYFTGISIVSLNRMANQKMKVVASAVKAYKAKYGGYPQGLQQLVPEFLKGIPSAKPTLSCSSFFYSSQPQSHFIQYQVSMTGNREYYNFDRDRWGYYQIDSEPPAKDYQPGVTFYADQPSRVNAANRAVNP